jgi:hypothetical protein
MTSFNERPSCRYIHDGRPVAWTNPREHNAVLLKALTPWRMATVDSLPCYGGAHMFDRTLNLRMRVRPVSPNTRTTYWESPRPRM